MQDLTQENQRAGNTHADQLNRQCYCATLDRKALNESLRNQFVDAEGEPSTVPELHHLFSNTPVFVPRSDIKTMERIVQAIESAAELPLYQEHALSWAPAIAHFDPGPIGVFMGYDFHLGADGPQLIEINTNAGGAFLNTVLARAQHQCCDPSQQTAATKQALDGFEDAVLDMFQQEWQRQRADSMPSRLAIVDTAPETQFMYPEFQLAQQLFQARGIDTLILDPSELEYVGGALTAQGKRIDMVYNRLVDFALDAPAHEALRHAYLDDAVVVTPNPRAHALMADKRNLILLSDPTPLRDWGLTETAAGYLESAVPKTRLVSASDAAELWSAQREWFFKPVAGHGGHRTFFAFAGHRGLVDGAAWLVDQVLPERPIQQWVLSLPFPMRFLLATHPTLIGRALGIVYRVIAAHLIKQAGYTQQSARTGAVTLIQRFGSALNLNVHMSIRGPWSSSILTGG